MLAISMLFEFARGANFTIFWADMKQTGNNTDPEVEMQHRPDVVLADWVLRL